MHSLTNYLHTFGVFTEQVTTSGRGEHRRQPFWRAPVCAQHRVTTGLSSAQGSVAFFKLHDLTITHHFWWDRGSGKSGKWTAMLGESGDTGQVTTSLGSWAGRSQTQCHQPSAAARQGKKCGPGWTVYLWCWRAGDTNVAGAQSGRRMAGRSARLGPGGTGLHLVSEVQGPGVFQNLDFPRFLEREF